MKALSNNGSQWLLQQFLAELMQNQVFYTHISKLACQYAARQALLRTGLAALFSEGELGGVSAGLHLSLRIPWPPHALHNYANAVSMRVFASIP